MQKTVDFQKYFYFLLTTSKIRETILYKVVLKEMSISAHIFTLQGNLGDYDIYDITLLSRFD